MKHPALSDQEYNATAALHSQQWRQAKGSNPMVTCGCGLRAPIRFLYRCLYCGVFFCEPCAEAHFGKSKAAWKIEQRIRIRKLATAALKRLEEKRR